MFVHSPSRNGLQNWMPCTHVDCWLHSLELPRLPNTRNKKKSIMFSFSFFLHILKTHKKLTKKNNATITQLNSHQFHLFAGKQNVCFVHALRCHSSMRWHGWYVDIQLVRWWWWWQQRTTIGSCWWFLRLHHNQWLIQLVEHTKFSHVFGQTFKFKSEKNIGHWMRTVCFDCQPLLRQN